MKDIVKQHAYQNIPLWYDQAYELGCRAIEVCQEGADELLRTQTITTLSALHNRATYAHRGDGITSPVSAADQIAGVCAAVFCEDIAQSAFGFAKPKVPYAMDNCGMGGDLIVTANISTIAALVAAAAGIPMCKHGSPANADSGRHGSSDFIQLCGIDPFTTKTDVERVVEEYNFGYTEALDTRFKRIHLQTHKYAQLPHMNDLLGPITNPVCPTIMSRRVLGVNHLVAPATVAEAYRIMNEKGVTSMEHLTVVRGYAEKGSYRGIDELSICPGGTEVAFLAEDRVATTQLHAEDFGLEPVAATSISPPEGTTKGAFSLKILHGEISGAPLEIVLANAALLFSLADPTLELPQAYEAARATFESGSVPDVIRNVRDALPHAA